VTASDYRNKAMRALASAQLQENADFVQQICMLENKE
jgi:malonyl CoA-acyl carrier protein transacylase